MPLFNLFKTKSADPEPNKATFPQPAGTAGLGVTTELEKATVARIARECRDKNQKFRYIEFDLENDRDACLNGLFHLPEGECYDPSVVRRITKIFEKPEFFVDGANANDIVQGDFLGNCWFRGLVETFCVARDEETGVYGFIFSKDDHWVHVVIDDLLYTAVPKFEELSMAEKNYITMTRTYSTSLHDKEARLCISRNPERLERPGCR
ncbi:hypothetical protein B0H17DRAFT_1162640 [Mycena rosella]|uniref:Calpain catalytic domain-containing protein n=1 Tax=Mycena rosella TaxID=1033263 RepID=A0AAD7CZ44_MYCRO|nr:hypothetical protein B0H17DRAFT_1162640 [Mycena rosella]